MGRSCTLAEPGPGFNEDSWPSSATCSMRIVRTRPAMFRARDGAGRRTARRATQIPETQDDDVGRAGVRVRGSVPRVDARRSAAPSGVSPHARPTSDRTNVSGKGGSVPSEVLPGPTEPNAARRHQARRSRSPNDPPTPVPQPDRRRRRRSTSRTSNKIFWPAEVHEGRPDRVLPRRSRRGSCRTCESTRRADAIPGWHRGQVVLPEGRARVRAGLDPHGSRSGATTRSATSSYFVCDDEDSLVYIANLGSIPLHIWASRVGSLELPDWCVIDLDPKEAPFSRCHSVGAGAAPDLRGGRPPELRQDDRQDRAAHHGAARAAS